MQDSAQEIIDILREFYECLDELFDVYYNLSPEEMEVEEPFYKRLCYLHRMRICREVCGIMGVIKKIAKDL